jgi:hypothetical protein
MFADIASPGTVENRASNPSVDGATERTVSERWLRHHTELHSFPR